MPNHVSTILTVTGDREQLKTFRATHFTTVEDQESLEVPTEFFDFNTIIPMPESLNITSGGHIDKAIAYIEAQSGSFDKLDKMLYYGWWDKIDGFDELSLNVKRQLIVSQIKTRLSEEEIEEGRIALDNLEKYGYKDWYKFRNAEWGTKWGAYGLRIKEDSDSILVMEYNTAWSPATPIFQKLSTMYPDLCFSQHVLDEGMGFGGTQTWEDGEYDETFYDGSSLYEFCNNEFGKHYIQCKCGDWFETDWLEEDDDHSLCDNCNYLMKKEG